MSEPHFPLGVELMDDDHAAIETMLETAATAPDDQLRDRLVACRDEIAAHFAREEHLMAGAGLPVLACHKAQHRRLIEDVEAVLAETPVAARLRDYLGRDLPNLIMAHIASVDQMAARFLNGDLPMEMIERLRIAEENAR